jgi:hypothetical protein
VLVRLFKVVSGGGGGGGGGGLGGGSGYGGGGGSRVHEFTMLMSRTLLSLQGWG